MNTIRETLYNNRWYHVEVHSKPSMFDWPTLKLSVLLLLASWAFLAAFWMGWAV